MTTARVFSSISDGPRQAAERNAMDQGLLQGHPHFLFTGAKSMLIRGNLLTTAMAVRPHKDVGVTFDLALSLDVPF